LQNSNNKNENSAIGHIKMRELKNKKICKSKQQFDANKKEFI